MDCLLTIKQEAINKSSNFVGSFWFTFTVSIKTIVFLDKVVHFAPFFKNDTT